MKSWYAVAAVVAAALTVVTPAWASFPGENGRIVFSSNRVFPSELYSMNEDGTDIRRLTWNGAQDQFPRVSPDGSRIAFARTVAGNDLDIWIMNADGTGERQLTSGPARDDQPAFTQDGTEVVFQRVPAAAGLCPCEVRIVGADGSGERRVETGPGDAANPDVSKNGKLAFVAAHDGTRSIYVTNLRGGPVKRVTEGPALNFGDYRPRWSPRGNDIVFMRNELGPLSSIDVWTVHQDGTDLRRLTTTERIEDFPQWSPDGTRIVFAVLQPVDPFAARLYTMDADGSDERLLPQMAAPFVDTFDDGRDDASVWHVLSQGTGITSIEAGGRVVISAAANAVPADGPGYRALETHYGTQCSFEGDYEISMDYELLEWPLQNGFQVLLGSFFSDDFIWRESRPWGESYFAFADDRFNAVPTMDDAGSLRIVRSDGTVTASYLENGIWVSLLTGTSSGHAVVGFQLADYNFFTGKAVSAAFDNFRVDSGSFTCPSRWRDTNPDWAVAG
jgi:TolB protein